jgi:hypothetical protein
MRARKVLHAYLLCSDMTHMVLKEIDKKRKNKVPRIKIDAFSSMSTTQPFPNKARNEFLSAHGSDPDSSCSACSCGCSYKLTGAGEGGANRGEKRDGLVVVVTAALV